MKNLLVDALRQAKAEQPSAEPEDEARLGETPLEGASNDGDEFVEDVSDDSLELMQTTSDLVVVDVEIDPDSELDFDRDADAAFEEAFELNASSESPAATSTPGAVPVRHERPDGLIEHSARWLPLLCVVLVATAMSAIPFWNSVTSDDGELGLTIINPTLPVGRSVTQDSTSGGETRFPFSTTPVTTAAPVTEPTVSVSVPEERPEIVVNVRERTPVGATDLREDTFSTIAALYRAHLAGEVPHSRLAEILTLRARQRQAGTEAEIKLLLQQYPNEPLLYNALGTLLAEESRWPEARAAFDRAAEIGEPTP